MTPRQQAANVTSTIMPVPDDEGVWIEELTVARIKEYLGDGRTPFQIRKKQDGSIYTVLAFLRSPFNNRPELLLFVDGLGDISIFDAVKDYEVVA